MIFIFVTFLFCIYTNKKDKRKELQKVTLQFLTKQRKEAINLS